MDEDKEVKYRPTFFICFVFLSSVAEKMDNAAIIAIIVYGILSIMFVLYVVLAIP